MTVQPKAVTGAPLIIGLTARAAIAGLIAKANADPIDMPAVLKQVATAEGRVAHMQHMHDLTIEIAGPWPWLVTFSIERGHPAGVCRHMSVSIDRPERVPNEHAVWMIAQEFGFKGGLDACRIWLEDPAGHGRAINVVQPIGS